MSTRDACPIIGEYVHVTESGARESGIVRKLSPDRRIVFVEIEGSPDLWRYSPDEIERAPIIAPDSLTVHLAPGLSSVTMYRNGKACSALDNQRISYGLAVALKLPLKGGDLAYSADPPRPIPTIRLGARITVQVHESVDASLGAISDWIAAEITPAALLSAGLEDVARRIFGDDAITDHLRAELARDGFDLSACMEHGNGYGS